jgi:hypothetical protein
MTTRWFAFALLLAPSIAAAQSSLILDRGLPKSNLNNDAGAIRSNVRWSWYNDGFIGDDFTIGALGERWVIEKIRTWAVPGIAELDPENLGDAYQDVRLYFGGAEGDLTPVMAGRFTPGSSQTDNPAIAAADATRDGVLQYDDFGHALRVWQIDFNTPRIVVEGGVRYRFGVWGLGRSNPDREGRPYAWFNHASSALTTDTAKDAADNLLLMFDPAGKFKGSFDANGSGWDKSADINIQVFGHKISEKGLADR